MSDDRESGQLASADAQIRSIQAQIDDCHLDLCATASVIPGELYKRIGRMKSVVTTLAEIDAHWAQGASVRLQEAIRESEIKRGDREANMLLSLPQKNEESYVEWIREMRL